MKTDVASRLPEYVLGLLPAEERDEMDVLVGASPELQREVAEISEALALSVPPIAPSALVKTRLLESLGSADRFRPFFAELARRFDLAVDAIRALATRIDDPAAWEASPVPWIRLIHFAAGPGVAVSDAGFVRVDAGATFPLHRHLGPEANIVLEGTMHDGERVYGPGDVVEWDTDSVHEFRAGSERPLVLAAAHNGIQPADPSLVPPKYRGG